MNGSLCPRNADTSGGRPKDVVIYHIHQVATRDIVGRAVGMGGSTYQHAKQVVVAVIGRDFRP
jgi:hypothetical protein